MHKICNISHSLEFLKVKLWMDCGSQCDRYDKNKKLINLKQVIFLARLSLYFMFFLSKLNFKPVNLNPS